MDNHLSKKEKLELAAQFLLTGIALVFFLIWGIGQIPSSYEYYCTQKYYPHYPNCDQREGFILGLWVVYYFIKAGHVFIEAISTLGTAVFAGALLWFTHRQSEINKSQVDISRDAHEFTVKSEADRETFEKTKLRARIKVLPDGPGFTRVDNDKGDGAYYRITAKAMNIGQSIAFNVETVGRVDLKNPDIRFQHVSLRQLYQFYAFTPHIVAQLGSKTFSELGSDPDSLRILVPSVHGERFTIHFWGRVKFEDILGDRWSQEFTWDLHFFSRTEYQWEQGHGSQEEVSLSKWTTADSKRYMA